MRFESVAKEFLNLSADVIPVPIPDTIKEKAMSFSINLIGEVLSKADGEAKRIETLVLADIKKLIASYDSFTGGTFKGSVLTNVDLTPVRPTIPPTQAPTSTISTPADAPTPATVAAPVVVPVAPVPPVTTVAAPPVAPVAPVAAPPAAPVTTWAAPPVAPVSPVLADLPPPPVQPAVVTVVPPVAPPVDDDEVAEAAPGVTAPFAPPGTPPA